MVNWAALVGRDRRQDFFLLRAEDSGGYGLDSVCAGRGLSANQRSGIGVARSRCIALEKISQWKGYLRDPYQERFGWWHRLALELRTANKWHHRHLAFTVTLVCSLSVLIANNQPGAESCETQAPASIRGHHVYRTSRRSWNHREHRGTRRESPHHDSCADYRERVEGRQQRRRQRRLPDGARHHAESFCADLAAETWARTSLSRITRGAQVNLELPLKADGRLGGHIVQGHVDGVARFVGLEPIPDADDFWLHLDIPEELEKYVVFKGSISH